MTDRPLYTITNFPTPHIRIIKRPFLFYKVGRIRERYPIISDILGKILVLQSRDTERFFHEWNRTQG